MVLKNCHITFLEMLEKVATMFKSDPNRMFFVLTNSKKKTFVISLRSDFIMYLK